ncbi:MAG: GDP-mannose 4,6-dehydratase [Vicinamibacteria bacterium]|nr:GDP-mannose 4,6-dehydratase [Vicinamibacteria bacterium]
MKGRAVLVTGASGFIGSWLTKALLEGGAAVRALVRYRDPLRNPRLREVWTDLEVLEADLRNRGALREALRRRVDVVFHLAAYNHVGQSFVQVEECFDVNAKGTANLLDECREVGRFVHVSTSEVYGRLERVPFEEGFAPEPASPYGVSKLAGEQYCRLFQGRTGGPEVVILRPFNAYGPGQSAKAVIPELILAGLAGQPLRISSGRQTREFNHVSDLVRGILAAAVAEQVPRGPVNLASGRERTVLEVAQQVHALTGSSLPLEVRARPDRPNEIWRMCGDGRRARAELGWEPRVDFMDGLRQAVEWYRSAAAADHRTGRRR